VEPPGVLNREIDGLLREIKSITVLIEADRYNRDEGNPWNKPGEKHFHRLKRPDLPIEQRFF
jgi:hypothetical protein